jgi:hypothetical protein
MGATMPFPPFEPDVDNDLGDIAFPDIMNAVPRGNGYGPFKDLTSFTQALPAACRAYFFARRTDGSIAVFAGTSTELYLLNNTTFAWALVSKATYAALATDANWQFVQFNDLVVAVQANTPPQKFTLASSTNFADLGGSPPNAGGVAVVGFFMVLTQLLSNPRRVIWSDLASPEVWTAGVGLADFEDLPDGGSAVGISGGDAYGLLFQEQSIRTMTYAPGSSVVFQINRISTQETLFAKYSIINVGERSFYCGAAGFKMVVNGGAPTAIGKEKCDRFFFGDVDRSNLQLIIGASDPTATRVYWAYKSQAGQAGLFDKVLAYDWAMQRWSLLLGSGEWLASLSKPGLTLEQLDAIAPGALTVTGAADNGSGLIRLTLSAISNAFFAIAGQNFIIVQGMTGTVEANGRWRVNIIDSTHIDLIGSVFVHAYVSGGAIGGSLDALGFSLDSIAKSAIAQLSAVGPTNKLGFYDGPNTEAILNTPEVDGEGQMLFTSGLRPITDCAAAMMSIGYRNSKNGTIVYTDESAIDDMGWAAQLVESRYQRAKMRAPYGSSWTYAMGVQPDGQAAGDN